MAQTPKVNPKADAAKKLRVLVEDAVEISVMLDRYGTELEGVSYHAGVSEVDSIALRIIADHLAHRGQLLGQAGAEAGQAFAEMLRTAGAEEEE